MQDKWINGANGEALARSAGFYCVEPILYVMQRPRAWTLQAVQVYFQSVIATKDFIYFIYFLTFVTSHHCLKFALIPILCRSLERIAEFLRHNFSRSTLYSRPLFR
ncbi:hypothetical protein V6Z11_A10G267600 [Gossypium hirsutum]